MPRKTIVLVVLVIVVLASVIGGNLFLVTQVTGKQFNAVADSYVDNYYPTNTGNTLSVVHSDVYWNDNPVEWVYAYFMFDLSSIPSNATITSITLNTYIGYIYSGTSCYYQVTWADTNWAESTLTWANQPNHGGVGGYNILKIGTGGYGLGWLSWNISQSIQLVTSHLTTDKKMAYVIYPNSDFQSQDASVNNIGINSHRAGQNTAYLSISYTVPSPSYSITVKVVDANGNPISGAIITQPFSGTTDSTGSCTGNLTAGTYTFSASAGNKSTTQTITVSGSQTVPLTITGFTYQLTVVVKDQEGNPLPATVKIGTASGTCDQFGKAVLSVGSGAQTIFASVKVKDNFYNSSTTVAVSGNALQRIVIQRRFFWAFHINYTDGSPANGKVIATSTKETLTIPIVGGYGEAYLTDATYEFDFTESPAITLKSVSIVNDGDLYATVNEAQLTSTTTSTSMPQGSASGAESSGQGVPILLQPDTPIYILLGVIAVVFISAGIIRARRRKTK